MRRHLSQANLQEKVLPARDGARRRRGSLAVTCPVLISRQPYLVADPITTNEVVEAAARTRCSTRTAMTRSSVPAPRR